MIPSLLFLLIVSAPSRALQASSQVSPRLWDALLVLGPRERAIRRLEPVLRWGDALIRGFEVDDTSRARLRELREKLGKYDLEHVAGERVACGAPGAGSRREHFYFAFPEKGACTDLATFLGDPRAPLGAWSSRFQLLPSQREQGRLFQALFSGELSVGDFQFSEFAGFWENVLRFFEHHRSEDPLAIWRVMATHSPRFVQFIDRFFEVASIATPRGEATAVDLQWKFRVSTLDKHFPALYKRLHQTGRMGDTQGVVLNSSGQRVLKYRVRTDPRTVRLQFLVRGGKILPFDLEENPIAGAEPVRLSEQTDLRFQVLQAVRFEAAGIKLEVNNLRWDMDVRRQSARQSVTVAMRGYDRLDVSGSVLGFIPLTVVDAMIPKTMESGARQSLDTSVGAFGAGTTTVVGLSLERPAGAKPGRYAFEFKGALAENKFLQFMLKFTGSRFTPSDEEIGELGRLLGLYYSALRADYMRWVDGL